MSFSVVSAYFTSSPGVTGNPAKQTVPNESVKAKLHWKETPGAVRYRIQVALDSSFSKSSIKISKRIDEPHIEFNLPLGTYYWRVRAINALRIMVFRGYLRPRKFRRRLYFRRLELDRLLESSAF